MVACVVGGARVLVQRCGGYNFVVFCMCGVSCTVVHTRARRRCECSAPMLTALLLCCKVGKERDGNVFFSSPDRLALALRVRGCDGTVNGGP